MVFCCLGVLVLWVFCLWLWLVCCWFCCAGLSGVVVFLLVSWWLPVGRVGLFVCGLLLVFLSGVVVSVFFFWCLDRWGVCLFCCLLSCVLWLSSCLGFCCLLVFLLWCLLFGVLVLLVLVAGRVLSGVFSSGAVCGSSLIFLVCSCGWSAVAVLGFVLVVSTVFVCLVNESSAGADADLFVYK